MADKDPTKTKLRAVYFRFSDLRKVAAVVVVVVAVVGVVVVVVIFRRTLQKSCRAV